MSVTVLLYLTSLITTAITSNQYTSTPLSNNNNLARETDEPLLDHQANAAGDKENYVKYMRNKEIHRDKNDSEKWLKARKTSSECQGRGNCELERENLSPNITRKTLIIKPFFYNSTVGKPSQSDTESIKHTLPGSLRANKIRKILRQRSTGYLTNTSLSAPSSNLFSLKSTKAPTNLIEIGPGEIRRRDNNNHVIQKLNFSKLLPNSLEYDMDNESLTITKSALLYNLEQSSTQPKYEPQRLKAATPTTAPQVLIAQKNNGTAAIEKNITSKEIHFNESLRKVLIGGTRNITNETAATPAQNDIIKNAERKIGDTLNNNNGRYNVSSTENALDFKEAVPLTTISSFFTVQSIATTTQGPSTTNLISASSTTTTKKSNPTSASSNKTNLTHKKTKSLIENANKLVGLHGGISGSSRKDHRPSSTSITGFKPNMMKRTPVEQSITTGEGKGSSANDRLSQDNTNFKDGLVVDHISSIASGNSQINHEGKQVTDESDLVKSDLHKSNTKSAELQGVERSEQSVLLVSENPGFLSTRISGEVSRTTPLQLTWDTTPATPSWNVSSNSHRKSFTGPATLFHTTPLTHLQGPSSPTANPTTATKIKTNYGMLKYLNESTKTQSNPIANLKSRLDRFDSERSPRNKSSGGFTTQVPAADLESYLVDIYGTFITTKSVYSVDDNVTSLNTTSESVTKVNQEVPWPVKKEAIVEGDLVLGGLMMVHEREDTITCGPVMPQGGIQALEAMLYTLDRLNFAQEPLLPNITIGAHILDDCDKDTYGLEMAVDFIKGL